MYRAVFVDRDDTINKDVPYCSHPEEFELLPTVAQGIRLLNLHNFKVVVVTNQSGIARGYFTEEMLAMVHQKMKSDLAEQGAVIDGIYYCPHHPNDGCDCRKPNTDLFRKAVSELQIDIVNSYMIGDKPMDMIAAKKLNCKSILVSSDDRCLENGADFVCSDFYTAAMWVVNQEVGELQPCHT